MNNRFGETMNRMMFGLQRDEPEGGEDTMLKQDDAINAISARKHKLTTKISDVESTISSLQAAVRDRIDFNAIDREHISDANKDLKRLRRLYKAAAQESIDRQQEIINEL